MNELRHRFVNIVLSVEEGRGFDLVKCPFYVTASFHGRKMNSDIVEGAHVIFNTEMVWETERKLIRKARGTFTNIRLECRTSERKLIGFTLLCLRNAKIFGMAHPVQTEDIRIVWTKLVNVPNELKRSEPELSVFLMIRDYVANVPPKSPMRKTSTTPRLPKLPSLQIQQIKVPVRYAEEGFIQLGSADDCTSKFQLKISVLVGSDLDVLLPESMVFGNTSKSIYLSVEIFGLEVQTRKVSEEVFKPMVVFNEAIVINLQSNLMIMGTYFTQFPEIKVNFYAANEIRAWTYIEVKNLGLTHPSGLLNTNTDSFKMKQVCFFEGYYRPSCSSVEMRRATVTTECYLETVKTFETEDGDATTLNTAGNMPSPAGDSLTCGPVEISLSGQSEEAACSTASGSSSNLGSDDANSDKMDLYHQFLLKVKIESIAWIASLNAKKGLLKMVHPLADNAITKEISIDTETNKKIVMEGVECSLSLASCKNRMNYMMMNFIPRIELYDAETKEIIGRLSIINFSRFYFKRPGPAYTAQLLAPSGAEIATMYVSILAKEMTNWEAEVNSLSHLAPCILDEGIIVHSLQELNQWQLKKREEYEDKLFTEKCDEFKRLGIEFQCKTLPLQENLMKNLEKCRTLVKKQEMRQQLAIIDTEVDSLVVNQEDSIVMEIHKNSIKLSLADKQELIESISELEVRNATMRELLCVQSLKIQELKKNQLTAEQTKVLLRDLKIMEEKYEIAQNDKNYYKREYEKAMKEVHNLKMDYHKNIATKIHTSKQELTKLVVNPKEVKSTVPDSPGNNQLPDDFIEVSTPSTTTDDCAEEIKID